MKVLVLWSDALIYLLVIALCVFFYRLRKDPQTRERWGQVFGSRLGMITFTVIITYVGIALLDSLHFRRALDAAEGVANGEVYYDNKVTSLLDVMLCACSPTSVREASPRKSQTGRRFARSVPKWPAAMRHVLFMKGLLRKVDAVSSFAQPSHPSAA